MRIWYFGAIFVVIPMVGNSAIRGLGDTKTPSMVMLIAAIANTVLDPLLIFGIGPFPELGVRGAAITTVIARSTTFTVAIPNTLTKIIIPLGAAIITRLIASYGRESVAGFGVASKLEMFALMTIMALSSILPVFIGQNLGAGRKNRVLKAIKLSGFFSLYYGIIIYFILRLCAGILGGLTQMFPLYIPMALFGSKIFGIRGIFGALSISLLLIGPVSFYFARRYIIQLPLLDMN